jgi:ABC-2 type transport system permease protein
VSRIWAIFSKEVRNYFLSPIAYVVMTGFMVLSGLSFYFHAVSFIDYVRQAQESGALEEIEQNRINFVLINSMMGDISVILLFLVPVLTMRLLSEEKRMRTDELLLTSPVTVNQIMIGKYLAGLFFSLIPVFATLIYIWLLYYYGAEPDSGMILTTYIGMTLYVAAAVSIGVFTSSLTENQIVASVACLILELLFATCGVASGLVDSPILSKFLAYLSNQYHVQSFMDGVLITGDITFFICFIFFFLFLTNRSIESSRWR